MNFKFSKRYIMKTAHVIAKKTRGFMNVKKYSKALSLGLKRAWRIVHGKVRATRNELPISQRLIESIEGVVLNDYTKQISYCEKN